jgi:hypothetical protein
MNVLKGDSFSRLTKLTPEVDWEQMAMRLPPVTSAVILIAKIRIT